MGALCEVSFSVIGENCTSTQVLSIEPIVQYVFPLSLGSVSIFQKESGVERLDMFAPVHNSSA